MNTTNTANSSANGQSTLWTRRNCGLPNFSIVGAMKSGTTSLHHILKQHQKIFIPNHEIFFFDIDDIQQHPDFFVKGPYDWSFFDYDKNFSEYLKWYRSLFSGAQKDQIIGDRSTTYLASLMAAGRIAKLLPDIKLIFMLRDPVTRAYSHYWHLVRSGQAVYDFESTIQYMPENILNRGFYKQQIERYKSYFPEDNMRFIIFEKFIGEIQKEIDNVCTFLGLEYSIDLSNIETHQHATKGLKNIHLQILFNNFFRYLPTYSQSHLPNMPNRRPHRLSHRINKWLKNVNAANNKEFHRMKSETRKFLQALYARENKGLSELIGVNVHKYWPYMKKSQI